MKLLIYADGGARGNPGPAAVGVVLKKDGQTIKKYGEYIGEATNNQAEYQAIIFGLKKTKLLFGKKKAKEIELEFLTDSELAARQLNHKYKIKEKELQPLFLKIWNLTIDFKNVSFSHILREKNKEADALVNEALDSQSREQKTGEFNL